jgi:hypothetical protein
MGRWGIWYRKVCISSLITFEPIWCQETYNGLDKVALTGATILKRCHLEIEGIREQRKHV